MTEKELCNNGWRPESCKIGTLYFKGVFFCRLDGEKVLVFSVNDDMNPLGTAETLDEIKEIQMQYELDRIHTMEERLVKVKTYFENVYGVKPEEILEEGKYMKINKINKQLYESAFIQNGEYGYHDNNTWKPSINEREETMCCGDDGEYVPATPLGYRDYTESRLIGLKNILDQVPCVDLTNDKLHKLKREDNIIKQYDKIKTDKGDFVVVGDDENMFYVVGGDNHLYYVEYVKDGVTIIS